MKKLLIFLTTLLVILFHNFEIVNAESISIPKNIMDENTDINSSSVSSTYYYYYNSSDTYKNKLDNLIEEIKNNHEYYYISLYGIYYWDDQDISVYAGALKYENTSGYVYSMFDFIANNPNKSNIYKIEYYSYINNNNSNPTIYNNNTCLSPYMLYFSSTGQTNNAFDFSSYWVTPDIIYFSPKKYSNVSVVYDPYYLTSIFENDEYNSVYIVYDSISTPSSSYSTGDYIYEHTTQNKIYQYEDEIDTSNLSYIKIIYDTTGSTYDDYSYIQMNNVSSKLKEAYFEKSYDWGICLDENTCYDKYIYRDNVYYTNEENMYLVSFPFKFEDRDHGYYDETQELDYFYVYYDVSNISDIVNLSIDSTKQFSVELGYMEDYVDTFVEIDLKNYSGIVLFPKVNLYNGDYIFYLKNADVNIHHYYKNNLVNIYKNITAETYLINQVEYQDRNRYYLIENNKVDQDSYISFDTRYFSYQLLNTTSESVTILNPNTNENQNISSIDSSNLNYDISHKLDNVDSLVDRVGLFIDGMKEYINIFSELFECAYSNLNSDCQTFIVVIFIIILIVGLILILRR